MCLATVSSSRLDDTLFYFDVGITYFYLLPHGALRTYACSLLIEYASISFLYAQSGKGVNQLCFRACIILTML